MSPASSTSILLIEECYASADQRFVELMRGLHDSNSLAALTNRWLADPRPWAWEQIFRYLAEPFDQPGHAVVVKRLFHHAEKTGDAELMGAFLTAFDCLVRRVRRQVPKWDRASRSMYQEEKLHTLHNSFRSDRNYRDPVTGKKKSVALPVRPTDRLFHYRTRYYLQRRAWRFFRRLGFQKPEAYVPAVAAALARYRDADFRKGENYLDSWGFMHACFATHPAVEFSSYRAGFRDGSGLADLSPAPAFPNLWFSAGGLTAAVDLTVKSESRAVRTWAVKLIALPAMSMATTIGFADLRRLLFAEDPDIATAAVTLLEKAAGLPQWTVSQWLDLLEAPADIVADRAAKLMELHVHPDRLDAAACLELACARPVAVARLGFRFLKEKSLTDEQKRQLLPKAAAARCPVLAPELTVWCLDQLAAVPGEYDRSALTGFFDSTNEATRPAAWDWLAAHQTFPAWDDPILWSRLSETPYDDLRLRLVDTLARRAVLPGSTATDLAPLWTSVLLGVHRGSRQKGKATQQIAQAIRQNPTLTETLLPVLAAAVRSLRPPEHRAGLAAVASLMDGVTLTDAIQRHLPEVQWK